MNPARFDTLAKNAAVRAPARAPAGSSLRLSRRNVFRSGGGLFILLSDRRRRRRSAWLASAGPCSPYDVCVEKYAKEVNDALEDCEGLHDNVCPPGNSDWRCRGSDLDCLLTWTLFQMRARAKCDKSSSKAPCGPCDRCTSEGCEYTCTSGQSCCGTTCADLQTDPRNCGRCGYVCPANRGFCTNGLCTECTGGLSACPTGCVDLSTDHSNCGACGFVCPPNATCIAGTCAYEGPFVCVCANCNPQVPRPDFCDQTFPDAAGCF